MKPEIVKVQVPLFTTDFDRMIAQMALVYAKNRENMREQPISLETIKALGGDKKGYFEAHWSIVVGWVIGKRVDDQEW